DIARIWVDEQKINFICRYIEQLNLDQTLDLIISNATFQWFNHLEVTVQKLCYALKETGWLTFSTFGERTFHELYTSYEQALSKLNIQKRTRLGQSFY